ncbi:ABC transporter permease [Ureaplasma diversum]|uniref:ABC transporter permease n=1 Tax=Ureaplasma diversum TaxID=42094 RepID=UPI000AB24EB9|nr:ABC transporter permease [Ureaplasma diversum]
MRTSRFIKRFTLRQYIITTKRKIRKNRIDQAQFEQLLPIEQTLDNLDIIQPIDLSTLELSSLNLQHEDANKNEVMNQLEIKTEESSNQFDSIPLNDLLINDHDQLLNQSNTVNQKIDLQIQEANASLKKVIKKKPNKFLPTKNKKPWFDRFRLTRGLVLTIPYVLLTLFLLIIPIAAIVIKSFVPNNDPTTGITTIADNWAIVTPAVGEKIFHSLWIAVVATIFCIIIAYPFTYFLSISKSKMLKIIAITLITAPIWLSLLVKLIGLKTLFDVIHGEINSTYGHMYTVIGLTYIYLPFMMLPLYNTLTTMPKNITNASYDLGRGFFYTFFHIVIPYTKNALLSGISIVFLSSFTSVAVAGFLNNSNSGGSIGDEIAQQGQAGIANVIQLSRASTLTLVISLVLIGLYLIFVLVPKIWKLVAYKRVWKKKNKEVDNEKL